MAKCGIGIDISTVAEYCKRAGKLEEIGGPFTIMELENHFTSTANIEAHARIVLQHYMKRQLISIGGNLVNGGYSDDTDVFEMIDGADSQIFNLNANITGVDYHSIGDVALDQAMKIEDLRHRENKLTGVPSGYHGIDDYTNGWQSGNLIIIAARPSIGKTAFTLNLARRAATHSEKPTPTAIFSLESKAGTMVNRVISEITRIPLSPISKGRIDDSQMYTITNSVKTLTNTPIYISDEPGLTLYELKTKLRKLIRDKGVGLAIIDYLQLMQGDGGNREQQIANISRGLKLLAMELNLPIIALSQLSRDVEKRKGKPQLSDLRESGAIEQDADDVFFLYRPSEEDVKADSRLKNTGEVLCRKHRNGELFDAAFAVHNSIQAWMSISEGHEYDLFLEQQYYRNPIVNNDNPAAGISAPAVRQTLFTDSSPIYPGIDGGDDLPF